jgi:hypothetical protein
VVGRNLDASIFQERVSNTTAGLTEEIHGARMSSGMQRATPFGKRAEHQATEERLAKRLNAARKQFELAQSEFEQVKSCPPVSISLSQVVHQAAEVYHSSWRAYHEALRHFCDFIIDGKPPTPTDDRT